MGGCRRLTADTFVKAARQLDVSRPDASVASWLFTVARTVLADHWRRHYRYGEVEPIDDVQLASATEMGSPPGRNDGPERMVAQIIDDLPDKYGRVLELRYLRGFSVQETADELGVTPGNAKVLQHRALSRAAKSPIGQSIADRPDFTEVAGRYSLCPRDSAA